MDKISQADLVQKLIDASSEISEAKAAEDMKAPILEALKALIIFHGEAARAEEGLSECI